MGMSDRVGRETFHGMLFYRFSFVSSECTTRSKQSKLLLSSFLLSPNICWR